MIEKDLSKMNFAFIIGIGRSGTTILTQILNQHPKLHCLPEANFLIFFLHEFKDKPRLNEDDIAQVIEQIKIYSHSHPWVGWEMDLSTTKDILVDKSKSENGLGFEELCRIIYHNFKAIGINKDQATVFVDKNPCYTIYTSHISKAVPDAKFIFLIRDYRANVLSWKETADVKSTDIAFSAYRWKLFNQAAVRFLKADKEKVLFLKYEDLVLNEKREIVKIFQFLGIDNEDISSNVRSEEQLDLSAFDVSPQHKERFNKKYSDLKKSLNADRLNSWQSRLSKEEIKICETICGDFALQFDYIPTSNLSPLEKLIIKFKNAVPIVEAFLDVKKDLFIYYVPVKVKIKRLIKAYTRFGFIKK